VAIGERCCPEPQGQPVLRADTVHQGDAAAGQGVYDINAVDQVTQLRAIQKLRFNADSHDIVPKSASGTLPLISSNAVSRELAILY